MDSLDAFSVVILIFASIIGLMILAKLWAVAGHSIFQVLSRIQRRISCAINNIHYVSDYGVVFQSHNQSCGIACVQMVLDDANLGYGRDIVDHPLSIMGTSMLDLSRALERYGLECKGLLFDDLPALNRTLNADPRTRAIVIIDSENFYPYKIIGPSNRWICRKFNINTPRRRHWAVLKSVSETNVLLRDPMLGLTEMSKHYFNDLWDGSTLIVKIKRRDLNVDSEALNNLVARNDGSRDSNPSEPEKAHQDSEHLQSGIQTHPPVLLRNVSHVYDQRVLAVRQLSLELRAGEVFCLLGPNGAGKSTLIKMITGVLPPSSGQVLLDGVDLWLVSDSERAILRRSLGYMPERPFFYDKLTPREYLAYIGELYGITDRKLLHGRIEEHLHTLRLDDKADSHIKELSHGMQRKIAFIAAQIHEPRLLLLDEPTLGLDPASARLMKDRLRELSEAGHTVLMTTHVLEIAERIADRVGIIDFGSLLFTGTMGDLRKVTESPDGTLEDLFIQLVEPESDNISGSGNSGEEDPSHA